MVVIWGMTWVAAKFGVDSVPPMLFVGTRYVAAGGILLLWQVWRGETLRVRPRDIGLVAAAAFLMVTGSAAGLYWAVQHVPTGLISVINNALMPLALLLLAVAARQEHCSLRQVCAIALGMLGLVLLLGPAALAQGGYNTSDPLLGWGIAAAILATLAYAGGSVLARPLLGAYPPESLAAITNFGGGIALVLLSLAFEPGARAALSGNWGVAAWGGWAFLVIFGSLIAYSVWLRLIRDWGASRAGLYAFISPIIAVFLGVLLFGETVHVIEAAGMAVMLLSAWLALGRRMKRPRLKLPRLAAGGAPSRYR